MFDFILFILILPAAIFVHIPSVLLLLALILASWFYRIRLLFWFPICFAGLMIPLLIIERLYRMELPSNFFTILFWASAFFSHIAFLFPLIGLIFSKIKNKKIDKLFIFGFLINIALIFLLMITNWHFYTYMP